MAAEHVTPLGRSGERWDTDGLYEVWCPLGADSPRTGVNVKVTVAGPYPAFWYADVPPTWLHTEDEAENARTFALGAVRAFREERIKRHLHEVDQLPGYHPVDGDMGTVPL